MTCLRFDVHSAHPANLQYTANGLEGLVFYNKSNELVSGDACYRGRFNKVAYQLIEAKRTRTPVKNSRWKTTLLLYFCTMGFNYFVSRNKYGAVLSTSLKRPIPGTGCSKIQ